MTSWLEHNLAEYRKEHQTLGNEICHFFGISLIIFSFFILGFLFIPPTYCQLILAVVFIWLALGGWRGLAVMFFFIPILVIGLENINNWQIAVGIFILGWVFQLIGHFVFEKNKPAFLKAPISLLIAIFWLGEMVVLYPLWSDRGRTPT